MKKLVFGFLLTLCSIPGLTQTDTCGLRISLLTCTPGQELYSTFGHSALRVTEPGMGIDIIYNYGTFDFADPGFYGKFVRGNLLYFVSVERFEDFMAQYQYELRGITEQVLALNCTDKKQLFAALEENAKDENKYYLYDFTYDNCTSRLRDMLEANTADSLVYSDIRPYAGVSFRDLIHEYLDKGKQYWSKLGIDILLGVPLDKNISNREAMFLPDYLLKAFDSSSVAGKPLVGRKEIILPRGELEAETNLFRPVPAFSILLLLISILSFIRKHKVRAILSLFDFLFFLLCGLLGCLILFMWFGTDHQAAEKNFNLAWALPTHLLMAFLVHRRTRLVKVYFRFTFWLTVLFLLSWVFIPQELNKTIFFIAGIILVRSFFIWRKASVEPRRLARVNQTT